MLERCGVWCGAVIVMGALLGTGQHAADAKERKRPDVAPLVEKAKEGHAAEAATDLGKLFRQAVKSGDVLGQQVVADAIEEALSSVDAEAVAGVSHAPILRALLAELGPRDEAALLPTHRVALELLLVATRSGEHADLAGAIDILASRASAKGASKAAKAHGDYAQALKALHAGAGADAAPLLERAFGACRENGWSWVGLHVGVEWALASATQTTGEEAGSAAVLALGEWLLEPAQRATWSYAQPWASARFQALPPPALEAWVGVLRRCPSQGGAGGAGGRGGDGGAGANDRSPVGKALERARRSTVLVEVTRLADGFAVRLPFDKDAAWKQSPAEGLGTEIAGKLGVTLGFGATGVRLALVDAVGNRGLPGNSPGPRPLQLLDDLAIGETWTVKADGTLTIK